MKYKYSICYPDKPEIQFPDEALEKNQIVQLVKSFDWDNEVTKEIEYYSPSLDFINLKNKMRLILSGFVIDELRQFQIGYIIPNDEKAEKAFDDNNYYNAEEYYADFNIEKSYGVLNEFLNMNYGNVISLIQANVKDNDVLVGENLIDEINTENIIAKIEQSVIRKRMWWEFWK